MLRMCSCAKRAKIFAILFENNLVPRTSKQILVKWTWAFGNSWLHLMFPILELEVQFQYSKSPDLDRGPPVE